MKLPLPTNAVSPADRELYERAVSDSPIVQGSMRVFDDPIDVLMVAVGYLFADNRRLRKQIVAAQMATSPPSVKINEFGYCEKEEEK